MGGNHLPTRLRQALQSNDKTNTWPLKATARIYRANSLAFNKLQNKPFRVAKRSVLSTETARIAARNRPSGWAAWNAHKSMAWQTVVKLHICKQWPTAYFHTPKPAGRPPPMRPWRFYPLPTCPHTLAGTAPTRLRTSAKCVYSLKKSAILALYRRKYVPLQKISHTRHTGENSAPATTV